MTEVITREPEPRDDPPARRSTGRLVLQGALIALPIVVLAVQAWQHRWIIDDGFINFRVVRQIEAGNGPVFNAGQRVEAFTSALWIWLLVLGDVAMPLRLEWVAVLLGLGGTLVGLGLGTLGSVRLVRRGDAGSYLLPIGTVIAAALAPVWYFTTSGLEGGITYAWIGAVFWASVRWARGSGLPSLLTGVLIGIGWLIRPELLILSGLLLGAMVVAGRADGWKRILAVLAATAAVPALYQLLRMGYYGQLVPNTAIAKEGSAQNWGRGWDYLQEFVGDFHFVIPFLALVLGAYLPLFLTLRGRRLGREQVVLAAFLAGALLSAVYVVRVGGDYIPARLFLPGLFMLLLPLSVVPLTKRYLAAIAVVPVWAVFAFAYDRPSGHEYVTAIGLKGNVVTIDAALRSPIGGLVRRYDFPGVYFNGHRLEGGPGPAATDRTVEETGVGILGYALPTDVRVLDVLGLADPVTAHFELERAGLPGHEKPIPGQWAAARLTDADTFTDPTVFQSPLLLSRPLLPPAPPATFDRQVREIRRVLRCDRVRRLTESYEEPLTVGRFFENVAGSFSNTSLRIPASPAEARRRLC